MSNAFLGQISMFGGNFAPRGWAFCNGQPMPIAQNDALYSLIGTTYGGDGVATFNLPDLRSRLPIHFGQGPGLSPYQIGQASGAPNVTLTVAQIPAHVHPMDATMAPGTSLTIAQNLLTGEVTGDSNALLYWTPAQGQQPNLKSMTAQACGMAGGNQPHDNLMPSLSITFIIALQGIYPSRN